MTQGEVQPHQGEDDRGSTGQPEGFTRLSGIDGLESAPWAHSRSKQAWGIQQAIVRLRECNEYLQGLQKFTVTDEMIETNAKNILRLEYRLETLL